MIGRSRTAAAACAVVTFTVLAGGGTASAVTKARTDTVHVALGPKTVTRVDRMLAEIDRRRVERYDLKLASFGTRNTLSSQDDPNRGIGAARDWLTARFKQFAARSGGRMTVEQQSFISPPGPRVPQPTRVTNVPARCTVLGASHSRCSARHASARRVSDTGGS